MPLFEYSREGFIPFGEYNTWYGIVGDPGSPEPGKFPVLALHGLPVSHESLEPLGKLIETGRPVIFYDQLGCGKSDQPQDKSILKKDLFVNQLMTVRQKLELETIHLFGHSFGGMLALEYLSSQPTRVASLTLHSTPVSWSLDDKEWERLQSELPTDVQETLSKHESEGTMDDPAYQEARKVFDTKHIWRLDPLPDYLLRSLENLSIADFDDDDLIAEEWDFRAQLKHIAVPTLITSGEYDTVTPMLAQMLHEGIVGSQWELFDGCSHYAHAEQPERFLSVLDTFLSRVEANILEDK